MLLCNAVRYIPSKGEELINQGSQCKASTIFLCNSNCGQVLCAGSIVIEQKSFSIRLASQTVVLSYACIGEDSGGPYDTVMS